MSKFKAFNKKYFFGMFWVGFLFFLIATFIMFKTVFLSKNYNGFKGVSSERIITYFDDMKERYPEHVDELTKISKINRGCIGEHQYSSGNNCIRDDNYKYTIEPVTEQEYQAMLDYVHYEIEGDLWAKPRMVAQTPAVALNIFYKSINPFPYGPDFRTSLLKTFGPVPVNLGDIRHMSPFMKIFYTGALPEDFNYPTEKELGFDLINSVKEGVNEIQSKE